MTDPLPPVERPTSPPTSTPPGGAAPPGTPPHPSGPKRPPQGAVLVVAALLGALVVVVGVLLWSGRDGDDSASPPPSTAPAPPSTDPPPTDGPDGGEAEEPPPADPPGNGGGAVPPGTPAVDPLPCPAEVTAAVCEAADFVQRQTGRAFQQFPVVELEPDDAFQRRLLDTIAPDLPGVVAYGQTLAALGLLDPDLDMRATLEDLYTAGVVGYYEPATDVLVVRGTEPTPYTRIVIVHELVHALDDQWFDVDRPHYDEESSEVAFGFATLVEGHARAIDERYRASLTQAERRRALQEEFQLVLGSDVDVFSLPAVLVEQLGAPYELGAPLVEDLLERGGVDALTAAFGDPPRTSEQVLDLEKYHAREPAIDVPAPPADGEIVEDDVLGRYALGQWLDGDDAAADGWGGDRYVTWTDGDASCTRIDLVMDTPGDLGELRTAVDRWAGDARRRTVEDITVAGQPGLRATGCTS